jgi:hypothetical protein
MSVISDTIFPSSTLWLLQATLCLPDITLPYSSPHSNTFLHTLHYSPPSVPSSASLHLYVSLVPSHSLSPSSNSSSLLPRDPPPSSPSLLPSPTLQQGTMSEEQRATTQSEKHGFLLTSVFYLWLADIFWTFMVYNYYFRFNPPSPLYPMKCPSPKPHSLPSPPL